jgi:hypothetical protein
MSAIRAMNKLTSTLAQLLNGFGNWLPAILLEPLSPIHLFLLWVFHFAACKSTRVSERDKDGGENSSGTQHLGQASSWYLLAGNKGHMSDERTVDTNAGTCYKAGDCLTVAVVLLSQVAGRVLGELVCGSNTGCDPN